MKTGEVIRKHREYKGLSICDLSKETSIPENIIQKIENDDEYINTPYGILHAKTIMKYLGIDSKEFFNESVLTDIDSQHPNFRYFYRLKSNHILHAGLILVLAVFIYANAIYTSEKVDIYKTTSDNVGKLEYPDVQQETQKIDSITLKSSGDVWITAVVDGEKMIFNLVDGETKTINFENKIAFETIGNVNKLSIVFGNKEIVFKDKEIVHNVFVDEEGVFYNGYNVLRGKPKI